MPSLGLSEKQLADRRRGIGSSEVARVVGLVPGAIDVWAEKVGMAAEREPSEPMEFGSRIEEVIGDAYQARHPETRIYTPGTLWHPTEEWACATPDRVVAPPGLGRPPRRDWLRLLEIKTVFFSGRDFGEGPDEIPERHLVQVAWQMECSGVDECTVVALLNGRYREYPILRDLELGQMLLDQVGEWWRRHVVAGVPPPADGSEAYTAYLRRRHPRDLAPPLAPTPELEALVAKVRATRATLHEAEGAEAEASNALRAALGDAAGVAGLCTYRANKPRTTTDYAGAWIQVWKDALMRVPDLGPIFDKAFADHTTTKPGARQLRIAKENP